MEHVYLERVNMGSVVSDLVLWNALDAGKAIRNLRILPHHPNVRYQALKQTKKYTRLGELERFALPDERRLHRFWLGRNMTDTWGGAQVLARMLLTVESQTNRTDQHPRWRRRTRTGERRHFEAHDCDQPWHIGVDKADI